MSLNATGGGGGNEAGRATTRIQRRQGVRTHVLLVLAMALVTIIVTSVCLLLIRHRLRAQVTDDFSQDLNHSVTTFRNLQAERLAALERENALLAELPTLKALMTSGDDLTIQDGAIEFWRVSGTDLFSLADSNGRVVAAYAKGTPVDSSLRPALQTLLASPDKHYLIDRGSLYACSLRPLYFGNENGSLLGYVISGVSIDRTVRQISQPTGAEAAFISRGEVVASTLEPSLELDLASQSDTLSRVSEAPATVRLGKAQFLMVAEDLSAGATSPLQLVVLRSFGPAELSIVRIDRIVLSAGLLALLLGAALMLVLSRLITRPLEDLSKGVRAFGKGDSEYRVPRHGTQEVRQLSKAFSRMRDEIQRANRALLESERLATIGRMASSVSHDLRHYLAAIYANAEFLASDRFSSKERAEIFSDIRTAVHGTTDMIESLLVLSRTGATMRRSPELMATLVERATALIRAHPDAEGVAIVTRYGDPAETSVVADGKQLERAISNLLLNACQSVRTGITPTPAVAVTVETLNQFVIVKVIDNGAGVPDKIRNSLFEPFVSEGKQKGTGLGLTLAHCIAEEHGGEVSLVSSRPGETIFQMTVACELRAQETGVAPEITRQDQVISDENVRI